MQLCSTRGTRVGRSHATSTMARSPRPRGGPSAALSTASAFVSLARSGCLRQVLNHGCRAKEIAIRGPASLARIFQFWDTVMSPAISVKELVWLGSSLRDMRVFPEEVRQVMGFALFLAQTGSKHVAARPLRGFGSAGVLEVVDDRAGDTYRAVYTVRFADAVYVLHAFRKKAKRGRATPQRDIDLVRRRMAQAGQLSAQRRGRSGGRE